MTCELFDRRLSIFAAIFMFAGVALGAVALATNYWTIQDTSDLTLHRHIIPTGEWNYGSVWNVGYFDDLILD
jgi:hypothetical protein